MHRLILLAPLLLVQDAPAIRVPYFLTETNHVLVRAKIDGKGPFSFILDTGAPTLFLSSKIAKEIGLEAGENKMGRIKRLEIEGGAALENAPVRIDNPAQLDGMNSMGLPGRSLHGVIGYTVLARFKVELRLTRRYMLWTKLDYEPPPLLGRKELFGDKEPADDGQGMMRGMAGLMKLLVGKRDQTVHPRGYLGFEIEEVDGSPTVTAVHGGGPADRAGLRKGDVLLAIPKDFVAGDEVTLKVDRAGREIEVPMTAGRGL
jgi:hypothetical protein